MDTQRAVRCGSDIEELMSPNVAPSLANANKGYVYIFPDIHDYTSGHPRTSRHPPDIHQTSVANASEILSKRTLDVVFP